MKVTTGEQEDCNKFVFQNGMLQKRELDGDGDGKHSNGRLKFGDVKGETESTAKAAQDQAVNTGGLRTEFGRKKLTVNGGYVNSMKNLLTA